MSLKLITFLPVVFLAVLVRAEGGWFCGRNAQVPHEMYYCSSDDVTTGFMLPWNYKPGGCLEDTAKRTRDVDCRSLNADGEMVVVDDGQCAEHGEKPVQTISSQVCEYDWACTANDVSFAACTEEDLVCKANDPEEAAFDCFFGSHHKVKCVNQSGAEDSEKCLNQPPANVDGTCIVSSGCRGQWTCEEGYQPMPSSLPEPCAKTDNTTGYADGVTCHEEYPSLLMRTLSCYYSIEDRIFRDETACDPATKPEDSKEMGPCAPWTKVVGACVWDRDSCKSGTAEVTHRCDAWQGCLGEQPAPTTEPCAVADQHCTYVFACAQIDTSVEGHQPCVVGDHIGFEMPAPGTCSPTVLMRSVMCRQAIMDGEQVIRYTESDTSFCTHNPQLIPDTMEYGPDVLCRYKWQCSMDDTAFAECTDSTFDCLANEPTKAGSQCYRGTTTRTARCLDQYKNPHDDMCNGPAPATTKGPCTVISGCDAQWVCGATGSPAPTDLSTPACVPSDTTTGFPDVPCVSDESGHVSREVRCYYTLDGAVHEDSSGQLCGAADKPVVEKAAPLCGVWQRLQSECVWDRKSCIGGIVTTSYECPADRVCVGAKPEDDGEMAMCASSGDHCMYEFACAPTDDTPLKDYQRCVLNDNTAFTLPEADACADTIPTRSVRCLRWVIDGESGLVPVELDAYVCVDAGSEQPNAVYHDDSLVCEYEWLCSIKGGASHTKCAENHFACHPNDPAKAASMCYGAEERRDVACYNQYMVKSPGKCPGAAPLSNKGACEVTSGCERKWVCSPANATPNTMPAEACASDDMITGFPAEPTCYNGAPSALSRSVGCYYVLDDVLVEDKTTDACPLPQPSTLKALLQCGWWRQHVGDCVWTRVDCTLGTKDVTYHCDAPQGCGNTTPIPYSRLCITPINHCSYNYVCAQTTSADPTQYSACAYGDTVGFELPKTGVCGDEVPNRAVACRMTMRDGVEVISAMLVDLWQCDVLGLEKPNRSYEESVPPCQYAWRCSADGTTFGACTDDQFTCQGDDPAAEAARCYIGGIRRTVACLNEDGRVVGIIKCDGSGARPLDSISSCHDHSGCPTQWVCAMPGSPAPATLPDEACVKDDVTTGFPAYPSCHEGASTTLSRDVSCYFVRGGKVFRDYNTWQCGGPGSKPSTTIIVDKCAPWTLQTGECVWDRDMDTCTVGTRTDKYVCVQGEGKCVADKPADITTACTFATSQCGYRYVCAPANSTTDDILDMTTAELSCGGDKHFAFDATACYKDKVFTRTVACFDAKNKAISDNAAEDCKDQEAPVDRVIRTDEQCHVDTYCAPTADAAESAWAKCVDEQGNNVPSTFGPCTVGCTGATQTRVARCVNELGSLLPSGSCDINNVSLEQYCAAPAQVSQVSVSSDTLTVGEEVEVQWCYYDGSVPTQGPAPATTTSATTATVTLSSASKKFFATVVASAAAKTGVARFDMPVVAPAVDAVLTVAVGALHSSSVILTVQSRCAADATYCGAHSTCNDATSTCTCTDGFTGVQCEVSPCYKCGGPVSRTIACVDSGPQAGVCVCEPGYEGATCEVKTECKGTRECQHGGFVYIDVEGACADVCMCTNKWGSAICDTCYLYCTSAANGKADSNCDMCVCNRGYSGSACHCRQAYGALVFAGASTTTLQDSQWLDALRRAILVITGLAADAVEVSTADANKGAVVVALNACPMQPEATFHTRSVHDTTALYAKWALVVADLKTDGSILKRGVIGDLGADVTVTAAEDMYDPTCTGDACAKGKDPFTGLKNTAAVAVLSRATISAVVAVLMLFL